MNVDERQELIEWIAITRKNMDRVYRNLNQLESLLEKHDWPANDNRITKTSKEKFMLDH